MEQLSSSEIPDGFLALVATRLQTHSVSLIDVTHLPGTPEDADPIGSGTLVNVGQVFGILTAQHVADGLTQDSRLGLTIGPEGDEHAFQLPISEARIVEIAAPVNKEYGPDLAFITIPQPYLGTVKSYKSFVDLSADQAYLLDDPPTLDSGLWFVCGCPSRMTRRVPSERGFREVIEFRLLCGTGPAGSTFVKGDFDYIDMQLNLRAAPNLPRTYRGMSGGGLWQVLIRREASGMFSASRYLLSGVVYYQTELVDERRALRSHGRRSVYQVAYEAISRCA